MIYHPLSYNDVGLGKSECIMLQIINVFQEGETGLVHVSFM